MCEMRKGEAMIEATMNPSNEWQEAVAVAKNIRAAVS